MCNKRSDLIHLATIGKPRGVKGEVTLHLLTDRPELVLVGPAEFNLADGRTVAVKELKRYGAKLAWQLRIPENFAGTPRDYASIFTNAIVVCSAEMLPERGEGEYNEFDLVGLTVVDTNGRMLGTFERVERRYEVDTWIVKEPSGKESDLPAVADFIVEVDLAGGRIVITPSAIIE